jgi:integrase
MVLKSGAYRPVSHISSMLRCASPEWGKLADATKAQWTRWLDSIAQDEGPKDIGGITFRALEDRRVRTDLLDWRDQWADRPRSADYAMQVLSRVLSWAVSRGLLNSNAAEGAGQLYADGRADQVWTPDEIERFTNAWSGFWPPTWARKPSSWLSPNALRPAKRRNKSPGKLQEKRQKAIGRSGLTV